MKKKEPIILSSFDALVKSLKMAKENVPYTLRSKCPWGANL